MRRLMERLYAALFNLQVKTQEQYIADLEHLLSNLLDDREALEQQINQTTERLLDAMVARDAHFCPRRRRQSDRLQTSAPQRV